MNCKFKIELVKDTEYLRVVEVWEASVRATHHFLKKEDILYFKSLILNEYLNMVELRCVKYEATEIVAFMGAAENRLEMLFIHPAYQQKGIGRQLLEYSINKMQVTKVDVNEQNTYALNFYKYNGFRVVGRSEFDTTGKPYPLLHMELRE